MIIRVLKGGSYIYATRNLRATYRGRGLTKDRGRIGGFRLIIRREA